MFKLDDEDPKSLVCFKKFSSWEGTRNINSTKKYIDYNFWKFCD